MHIVCYNKGTESDQLENFNSTDPDLIHNQIIPLIPHINKSSPPEDIPNVLLLAIDATSSLNFKRHFLRTEAFLREHHFYELQGYNKVGANTFPNMIPFLTGHYFEEFVSEDQLKNIFFDDWPIIWKEYSKKGFVTAFLEEMSWCGLFHYGGWWGFKDRPSDYMLRPFHMEIMKQKYNRFCYSGKTETEVNLHSFHSEN